MLPLPACPLGLHSKMSQNSVLLADQWQLDCALEYCGGLHDKGADWTVVKSLDSMLQSRVTSMPEKLWLTQGLWLTKGQGWPCTHKQSQYCVKVHPHRGGCVERWGPLSCRRKPPSSRTSRLGALAHFQHHLQSEDVLAMGAHKRGCPHHWESAV